MFDTLKTLLNNRTPSEEEINKINSFVMIKWLSGNRSTVIPANFININYNIPLYNQYKFLDDYFILTGVKKKINFIKFPKNISKESEIIENIQRYYNVNPETAKKYYELMSKEDKKRFNDIYTEGKIK
jgi:hypothetical protein